MKRILGLDIGGANIKAAHSNGSHWSEPFALWRAPNELGPRLAAMIAADASREFDEIRLTMTAELCDCFATKRDGVNTVVDAATAIASGRAVGVWSTRGHFVDTEEAKREPLAVAASNWHALGTIVASRLARAPGLHLLIDIGTTTADLIPLRDGRTAARGTNDRERLATGELVYTGAWRTPLMAHGPTVIVRGEPTRVMAEYFSSMVDVHLLLGQIPEEPGNTETADGRPATRPFAAARIVRMVGADLEMLSGGDATDLARQFAANQLQRLESALDQVVGSEPVTRFVLSGQGSFIARQLPRVARSSAIDLADLIGRDASVGACAWAMLQLPVDCPSHAATPVRIPLAEH